MTQAGTGVANDWPEKNLAQLGAHVTSGSRGWARYYSDHGVLFVRITNLRRENTRLDLRSIRFVQVDPDDTEAQRTGLRQGDILVSITADIGIIGLVDEAVPTPAYINQHIARVRLNPQLADSRFVAYYLASWTPQRRFVGATDQGAKAGMNLTAVASLTATVPPLAEQSAIADALDAAVEQVGALERLIAKKRDIKQGMMQELLTGRTRVPGYTGEWKRLPVADNSHLKARIGWQGLTTGEYLASGEYRLVGGTDIKNGHVDWGSTAFVDKWRFDQDKNIQLMDGDLLITKDGTIGKVAIVDSMPGPSTLNSGVFVLRPKRDAYNSYFIYWMLRSRVFEEFVADLSAGSTITHLYQRDLVTLNLLVPPTLEEQSAIARILTDADAEIDALERRLASARAVKVGMMQELLTGRTRLPVKEDA